MEIDKWDPKFTFNCLEEQFSLKKSSWTERGAGEGRVYFWDKAEADIQVSVREEKAREVGSREKYIFLKL